MSIKTVGVLGCGLMGSGIAQTCAAAGYRTIARDVSDAAVQKGIDSIRAFVENGVAKGKVTNEARDATIGNLSGVTDLAGLRCGSARVEPCGYTSADRPNGDPRNNIPPADRSEAGSGSV